MIHVSKLGDYAIVLMTYVAHGPGRAATARELAAATRLSVPTVSKVLKALAKGGLLASQRGKLGGYVLARPATEISVAAIVSAIDGPIGLTDCSQKIPIECGRDTSCPCRANWRRISEAIRTALEGVRLDTMSPPVLRGPPTPAWGAWEVKP